ncbi:hypothetical protein KM800_15165, partial [Clostridium tyrobutyricum]|uniref:GIY-YIG nuclease family protein n=1 Tax=Clostridium tyrobutyricum TaxID=1519 RepID=UPI001D5408B9|nr:hypothetical protein [Clostridium tyrobutyricum]
MNYIKIFLSLMDVPEKLPDGPGAYLICVKNLDALPEKMNYLDYNFADGLPVIYVGIAGRPTSTLKSLRRRDYKNHFNGTARSSTLRKSLGVLFGMEKEFTGKKAYKYRFKAENEEKLSAWMKNNLIMHFVSIDNPMKFEIYMIDQYEPPLNLKDNHSDKNKMFRPASKS